MNDYISTIIETLYFIIISCAFYSRKIKPVRILTALMPVLAGKLFFIIIPISSEIEFLSSCINVILGIISILIMVNDGILNSVICYVSAYILGFIIQFTFVIITSRLAIIYDSIYYSLFGSVYTLLAAVILYQFAGLNRVYTAIFEKNNLKNILLVNLFAVFFIIALYYKINTEHFLDVLLFVIVSISILLSMNILLFNQFKRIKKQSEQIKAYEQYLPVLNALIDNVRIRQHNHINEIQSIIALIHTYRDYDSLTNEMLKYLEVSMLPVESDLILKLNMHLVAGFLYQKKIHAASKNININYSILTYSLHTKVPEYELVELIGILTDNAVEASPADSTVAITIDSKDNKLIFGTRNPGFIISQDDMNSFFTKGYSTKNKKRHSGLGLYQLKNTVVSIYDGTVSVWNDGTDILFEIVV